MTIDYDTIKNERAPHVPYYTPIQPAKTGSVRSTTKSPPKLFTPLSIKNLTIPNRIGVSPMCMYSADKGFATPFHMIHYGTYANRGAGIIVVESVGVKPEGRISPNDLGIYSDEHALKLKEIVDYVHSQGKTIGVQLSHAGIKASTIPLYYAKFDHPATKEQDGWLDNVWGPSKTEQFNYANELNEEQISEVIEAFVQAIERAIVISGFDFVELHSAHGYLLSEFLSPIVNTRTDKYGGSFENRTRVHIELLEKIKKLRDSLEKKFPLFLRISASDNDESNPNSWRLEDTVKFAPILVANGVDVIDVSSGGNARSKEPILTQLEMAKKVKETVGDSALVAAVGGIDNPELANKLLEDGACDITLVGRAFLKTPNLVEVWAEKLNVDVQMQVQEGWPSGKVW
ncbi:hypothetical protein CANARDRAFT_8428 [[Candida] arabinofermentans NRRL YB-2248]|uniref:NADH:flavin oxidoreductase/NADH oxidase N-terminal domain-containing protein n=1 Tax=[Candida] arabinofermentans NRRL YB-2248 TaxID=983967 RepID=A0A1E4SY62_9ASCO|nr:hypothetical protein CANARDRAFT_8428 [[Candida] arabinofermentans NRRL YB-2248]